MPVSTSYRPQPRYDTLGPRFSDPVTPAYFPDAQLRWRDQRAARRVGLNTLTEAEWNAAFAQFEPLPENFQRPLSIRYHGHQFRNYNPDIGDGRGFLYAQLRDDRGRLLDLGTKGSGKTPYSRFGDGRMTLLGGLREVIAAGFLEALGVPGCAILDLHETGEDLERQDEPSPTRGAVMTRLQHSHLRIGVFQRQAYEESAEGVRAALEYAIAEFYPHLADEPTDAQPAAFLAAVAEANAKLCAAWMAAGFVHGVLNSDNMTVTGESFDYGPFRFLPVYAPDFTAAYFDQGGIYAYGRQAEATLWNLARLAECLTLIGEAAPLEAALQRFPDAYQKAAAQAFVRRLGLQSRGEEADGTLARALTQFAYDSRAPFEGLMFDWFGGDASATRALGSPRARCYAGAAFEAFRTALEGFEPVASFNAEDPYFARDWPFSPTIDRLLELWAAIDEHDDWHAFETVMSDIAAARRAYGWEEGA